MKALSIITLILFMTPVAADSPLYQKSGGYESSGGYETSGGYESSHGYERSGGYELIRGVDVSSQTFKSNAYRNDKRKNVDYFVQQTKKVGINQNDWIKQRHENNGMIESIRQRIGQQGGTQDQDRQ